jgi:hypothetical protein
VPVPAPVPSLMSVPQNATTGYIGDTVSVVLGNTGVGQPADVDAILSLSGTFTAAVIAIEAVPLGQPVAQSVLFGTGPPTAVSAGEWVAIAEVSLLNFGVVSAPIGPVSSTGLPGSALAYLVPCGLYAMLRLRLISIGSGTIQAGIATVPFPAGATVQEVFGSVNVTGDYLQQIFAILQRQTEPLGMNLLPITLNLPLRPDMNLLSST